MVLGGRGNNSKKKECETNMRIRTERKRHERSIQSNSIKIFKHRDSKMLKYLFLQIEKLYIHNFDSMKNYQLKNVIFQECQVKNVKLEKYQLKNVEIATLRTLKFLMGKFS